MCFPGNLRGRCRLTFENAPPSIYHEHILLEGRTVADFQIPPRKDGRFVFLLTKSGQDFPTVLFLQNFKSFIAGSDLGPVWETAISARGAAPFLLGCGFRVFLHSTHC